MSPREQQPVLLDSEVIGDRDRVPSESSLTSLDRQAKGVAFGSVSVRLYERIVGDHPDVRVGPPISIGWAYDELPEQNLDEYEESHSAKRKNLRLSSITRRNILMNTFEVDEKEIRRAEREVAKIQRQREETSNQGKTRELVDTAVQSTKRKIRRTFSRESFFRGLSAASGTMLPLGMHP